MIENKGRLVHQDEERLASLKGPDDKVRQLEADNAFLQEKLKVSEEKRKKEIDSNLDLFSTVQMQMKSALCS